MIYDLFHNDLGEYVAISPREVAMTVEFLMDGTLHPATHVACGHNHTDIYVSEGQRPYYPRITIVVDGIPQGRAAIVGGKRKVTMEPSIPFFDHCFFLSGMAHDGVPVTDADDSIRRHCPGPAIGT